MNNGEATALFGIGSVATRTAGSQGVQAGETGQYYSLRMYLCGRNCIGQSWRHCPSINMVEGFSSVIVAGCLITVPDWVKSRLATQYPELPVKIEPRGQQSFRLGQSPTRKTQGLTLLEFLHSGHVTVRYEKRKG